MLSKCLSVLLLVNAISCGNHGLRADVPIQQRIESINSRIPISTIGSQLIERNAVIPSTVGSSLPVTSFQVPQTIPQYLLSLPRTVNFEVPHSIPVQLLRLTAPGAVPQSLVVESLPAIARTSLISPVQKVRSPPIPVLASFETPIVRQKAEQSLIPVIPERASIPRFESNVYSGSNGFSAGPKNTVFSTPTKPLNFAPNLPEVDRQPLQPIAQTVETDKIEQIPEPVEQKIETPEIKEELITNSQPITQQITEQRIEALPPPLTQQRFESPVTQIRAQNPSLGLSSYSFV